MGPGAMLGVAMAVRMLVALSMECAKGPRSGLGGVAEVEGLISTGVECTEVDGLISSGVDCTRGYESGLGRAAVLGL